jgi:hypothetical protein
MDRFVGGNRDVWLVETARGVLTLAAGFDTVHIIPLPSVLPETTKGVYSPQVSSDHGRPFPDGLSLFDLR